MNDQSSEYCGRLRCETTGFLSPVDSNLGQPPDQESWEAWTDSHKHSLECKVLMTCPPRVLFHGGQGQDKGAHIYAARWMVVSQSFCLPKTFFWWTHLSSERRELREARQL